MRLKEVHLNCFLRLMKVLRSLSNKTAVNNAGNIFKMLETGVGAKLNQKILRKALRRGYLSAIIKNNFSSLSRPNTKKRLNWCI